MSELEIRHPSIRHQTVDAAVPATFVAIGIVPAVNGDYRLKSVDAEVVVNGRPAVKGKVLRLMRFESDLLRWVVYFKRVVDRPTTATLKVSAVYKKQGEYRTVIAERPVYLKPNGYEVPTFDWPPTNPYAIPPEERAVFFCCGETTTPISDLTLNGNTAPYFDWSDDDDYWWGEFYNVSGSGNLTLRATNTDGYRDTIVTIG